MIIVYLEYYTGLRSWMVLFLHAAQILYWDSKI